MIFKVSRSVFRAIAQFSPAKLLFCCASIIPVVVGACSDLNAASQANSTGSLTAQECEADPDFSFIAGGEYIRGSDRQERDYAYQVSAESIATNPKAVNVAVGQLRRVGWFAREAPRQTTYLAGFCLSQNLTTNREYQEFVRATGHRVPGISESDYQLQGFLVHPYTKVREFLWQDGVYPTGRRQHPVVLVSYDDAVAYARWKSRRSPDFEYRLPTAAEWEKAARGTAGDYFPWGNDWQANATNAQSSGLNYTSAIAQFPLSRSSYGIEDMAGNVFEYTSTLQNNDERVVLKGCSWDDLPGFCRAAYQHTRPVDSRHILFGFRLVKIANED